MHTAEIVERDVQDNSGLQIVQRFTGRIGFPAEPLEMEITK